MAKIQSITQKTSPQDALKSSHYWYFPMEQRWEVCTKCLEGECNLKTYMPAAQQYPGMDQEGWRQKEKRELFSKTVNSLLINNKDMDIEEALTKAEKVISTAFKLYG